VDEKESGNGKTAISDEYNEKYWRELIPQGLSHYDGDYYKSKQYYLDRGQAGMEKHGRCPRKKSGTRFSRGLQTIRVDIKIDSRANGEVFFD